MKDVSGLFKYLDASKLVLFEKCLILLTPPKYLNDPWDFLPKSRVPSDGEILKVWREIETDIARSSVIVVPVYFAQRERHERLKKMRVDVASKEFLGEQGKNYQKEISRIIGIVALNEVPLSRLMWAHYAQSHSGFVAEFAAGEESHCKGFVIRGMGTGLVAAKVKYPTAFEQVPLAEDGSNVFEVCCSKHSLWEYEKEWRIIARLRDSISCRLVTNRGCEGGRRFCVPFRPGNLRRVIFGMRMNPEVKQRLFAMLGREEFKHVLKQTTTINPETGNLELKPVESA